MNIKRLLHLYDIHDILSYLTGSHPVVHQKATITIKYIQSMQECGSGKLL